MQGTRRGKRAGAYDALSRWYSLLSESSEGPLRRECLDMLRLQPGEAVLDIGSGPGMDLRTMAKDVGPTGSVWGLDLSRGMLRECRRHLSREGPVANLRLIQADGLWLPFRKRALDVVRLSFTLELFETGEMPRVLQEICRVMHDGGRLGVVSLSSRHPRELATRVYWQAHRCLPGLVDCRPIDAAQLLASNGYRVAEDVERSLWGLRVAILVGRKT